MKCLVVSCKGLGDGLVSMILSNNLYINGNEVVTLHDGEFHQFQRWFKDLSIYKFPNVESVSSLLKKYDKIFVSYDSVNQFIQTLIKKGKEKYPDKIKVLNPSFSRSIGNQPFYKDACFRPDICMVDNIEAFCRNIINLKVTTKKNGMTCPYDLILKKHRNRVLIHPTSAKPGRSWFRSKFIKLYEKLKGAGFSPCFIMTKEEKKIWKKEIDKNIEIESFDTLDHLAQYIYESGYFIGNDSGLGHLASCVGVSVLSISRSKRTTDLWRPGWGDVKVVYPSNLIPNISRFRLRDKKWQHFISVNKIFKKIKK